MPDDSRDLRETGLPGEREGGRTALECECDLERGVTSEAESEWDEMSCRLLTLRLDSTD